MRFAELFADDPPVNSFIHVSLLKDVHETTHSEPVSRKKQRTGAPRKAFIKLAKESVNTAQRQLLCGEAPDGLSCSLIRLQAFCRSVSSDRKYIQELAEDGDRVFNETVIPEFRHNIMEARGYEVIAFLNAYKELCSRLWRLQLALMGLDDLGKTKLIPHYTCLFARSLVETKEESAEKVTFFNPEESGTRNRVLVNFHDLLYKYLEGEDLQETFERFIKCLSEIIDCHVQNKEYDRQSVVLFPTFTLCVLKVARDLKKSWLGKKADYVSRCMSAETKLNMLVNVIDSHVRQRHQLGSSVAAFLSLLLNNVDPVVFDGLFDSAHLDQLSFVYALYKRENWDLTVLSDLFCECQAKKCGKIFAFCRANPKTATRYRSALSANYFYEFIDDALALILHAFKNDVLFKTKFWNSCKNEVDRPAFLCDCMVKDLYNTFARIQETLPFTCEGGVPSEYSGSVYECARGIPDLLSLIPSERKHFIPKYASQLCRRLIHPRFIQPMESSSAKLDTIEFERMVVSSITEALGATSTERLQNIINSLVESNVFLQKFLRHQKQSPVDLSFCCLELDDWGNPPPNETFKMPEALAPIADMYQSQYREESKKRFRWAFYLHRLTVAVEFTPDYTQDIECSIYQAAILLAFEDQPELTLRQLLEITGMRSAFLEVNLKAMAKILSVSNSTYTLNTGFHSSKDVVKIPPSFLKSTSVPSKSVHTGTERSDSEMLRLRAQSFVTNTLKHSTAMSHDTLLQGFLANLKASEVPVPAILSKAGTNPRTFFKQVIDGLIGDEYIARNGEGTYKYLP